MKTILAMTAAAALAGAAPGEGLEGLAWLAGTWVEETDGRWTEERWAPPRGGVMLGTSLSGRGDAATSYEFARIAVDGDGKVAFFASPGGQPPVGFRLVSQGAGEVVFENPANDYPVRIAYRREGDVLSAQIEGPGGADPMRWRYRRARD